MRPRIKTKLIALVTLIGFLVGAFGPAVPHAVASQHCAMMMSSAPSDGAQPSKDMMPICAEGVSCIIAVTPAIPLGPLAAHFTWAPVFYAASANVLSGRAVSPEISPPIFRG